MRFEQAPLALLLVVIAACSQVRPLTLKEQSGLSDQDYALLTTRTPIPQVSP